MQAWQLVQVTNPESGYVGQAGTVRRVERNQVTGEASAVFVKLDTLDEVVSFDASELRILG